MPSSRVPPGCGCHGFPLMHMKVAIPLWQGRVSPVFDEASRLLVVHVSNGAATYRKEESLQSHNPFERAQVLPRLGVDLLICGMVSQMQQAALDAAGIRIIPHVCGTMEDVIAAYLDGRLENGAMRMPGCGCRKRLRHRRNRIRETPDLPREG